MTPLPKARPGALLMSGIVLASLTEAIAGTALVLGRNDIIGDTHATPDECAWLDIGYTAFKLLGFILASHVIARVAPRGVMIGATLIMGLSCTMAVFSTQLELLVVLRIIQGLAGGILLVAGQAQLFRAYRRDLQPLLQALFAGGAVVASASLTPALQGWLIDQRSWRWIFFSVVPLSLAASGLLLLADMPTAARPSRQPFDWPGAVLSATALLCFTYVLSQGSRWDWFEAPHILWLTLLGSAALLAFLGQQVLGNRHGLLDFSLFRSSNFTFAFVVSFVAGAALFGSAYLIPAFALSVLDFTLTDAGLLLLPGSVAFAGTLLVSAYLIQVRRVAPFATVPAGILLIMLAMWMLSGSTSESGSQDMLLAIILRGLGLGFLFLSITLIAFGGLKSRNLASGIGLFNTGRQLGGLMGVAGLESLIEHSHATNAVVLGSSLTPGSSLLIERLASTTTVLVGKGLDAAGSQAATGLLAQAVSEQSTVIAFDTAFTAVALLFVVAAPVLVAIKIGLARRERAIAP